MSQYIHIHDPIVVEAVLELERDKMRASQKMLAGKISRYQKEFGVYTFDRIEEEVEFLYLELSNKNSNSYHSPVNVNLFSDKYWKDCIQITHFIKKKHGL